MLDTAPAPTALSPIGGRIRAVRKTNALSQQAFAESIGIAQSSLSQIEKGQINPSLETLRQISTLYQVGYAFLIDGAGDEPAAAAEARPNSRSEGRNDARPAEAAQVPAPQPPQAGRARPSPDAHRLPQARAALAQAEAATKARPAGPARADGLFSVPLQGLQRGLPLVDQKASAGVLAGFADTDYLERQPMVVVPGVPEGLAIQVAGSSMEPTIRPGDILLCSPLGPEEDFKDNHIYVIGTREGALVKRVLDRRRTNGTLLLKSDNREFQPLALPAEEVLRVLRVRRRITADLSGPEGVYDRLSELEHALRDLSAAQERLEARLPR